MNDSQLNALKQGLTLIFGMLTVLAPTLATSQQYSVLTTAIITAVPALISGASVIWSIYSHWGMKKVPDAATALILPAGPQPVGKVLDLTPMSGLAKVVGALLIGFFVFQAMPASAQSPNIAFGAGQPKISLTSSSIATFLSNLADIDGAQTLATQIPNLQDNVGAACWAQFAPIQALIKAHPLPATLKIASDIEALRLVALAMNQICANPNCGQMFLDATNAAAAISGVPIPISLPSICSKIPVIGTTTATVVPAAPIVAAPVTVTPNAAVPAPAK